MPPKATTKPSAPAARVKRETPPGSLSSVTSALRLLRVFSAEQQELGISVLAKELGVAKSTAHRLAVTLATEGFLEQNPDNGRYYLGLALFELAALVRRRMDVSTLGRPLLEALRDTTQESTHMAVLAQSDILYLYNLESSQAVHARTYWGMRKPAFCTSEGRVLLAFGPPEHAAAVLKEGGAKRTPHTVVDAKTLTRMLNEVRRSGYALDDEESEIGMRGLAAPVRDASGRVIAAVGLSAPMQRMTKKDLRALVPQVVATASGISARMGYKES
ncbi:MAG: IclR family transcriptional regulator [Burkholderiaceae bacterium]|nr:IclR family transcriptional regulator [Burkholderiaceae bacterium]